MKAFKLSGDEKRIYFQNLNRIPAEEELAEVLKELKEAGCKIGAKEGAGLEDMYKCQWKGMQFTVFYTGEEAFIYSDKARLIGELMKVFE